jgi:hypothetical protein
MSASTVPHPPQKPKTVGKLPLLNPLAAPNVLCPNKDCLQVLTPKAGVAKKTGELILYYNCLNCKYDFQAVPQHVNGQALPEGKLELRDETA